MYLFSYFKDNGEDGLHLAASRDGLVWHALNEGCAILAPQVGGKLMRDPCICRGPDGVYHMSWTTDWSERGIGIAHSRDLANWSDQTFLPVMEHEPTALNCWAPEIFFDDTEGQYMIFWSTSIPGRFPETEPFVDHPSGNNRIYFVTTRDFQTYSPTALLYDDGFMVIDASIVKDGNRYAMFLKDETGRPVPRKDIRLAFADKPTGPWSPATPAFSPDWVEGPTALKIEGEWFLYFDAYSRGRYEGIKSRDLISWESITDRLSFPPGVRHGTALVVPDDLAVLRHGALQG
jgi:beta-xylosidase